MKQREIELEAQIRIREMGLNLLAQGYLDDLIKWLLEDETTRRSD